jgi:molybdopterin synthase catalytic subunit
MPASEDAPVSAPAGITVRCRFFARFAEVLGCESHELTLPAPATVGDAVAALRSTLAQGAELPPAPLAAVNCEHVSGDWLLADGDELALLPPLAGG